MTGVTSWLPLAEVGTYVSSLFFTILVCSGIIIALLIDTFLRYSSQEQWSTELSVPGHMVIHHIIISFAHQYHQMLESYTHEEPKR